MSPAKNLPAPGRAGNLTSILRSRHSPAEDVAPAIDPFTPQPVDPATVTGSAAERLAEFEAAIDRAKETAGSTLKASRARFVVEAGTALRAIRDEDGGLYRVTHATFEDYIADRWGMDRSRAYQLIDAAPVMVLMSKIFDTAPVESHARILAPVWKGPGEVAVRQVFASLNTAGEKVTAEAIRSTAVRLGHIPDPAHSAEDNEQPDVQPGEHSPAQARALVRLEQGLAALRGAHRALRGRVIPDAVAADHTHGSALVSEISDLAGKISRLAE